MKQSQPALRQAYVWCERFSRRSKSNFTRSFQLLRRDRRLGMVALYAFSRWIDDSGDGPLQIPEARDRLFRVQRWLTSLDEDSSQQSHGPMPRPLAIALCDTVGRFEVPIGCLRELVSGVLQDLEAEVDMADWEDLRHYCHRVASSVGTACMHIWGASMRGTQDAVGDCGIAFQLTNILRDLAEDAQKHRLYLPREDRFRFGVSTQSLLALRPDGDWDGLLDLYFRRTQDAYARAWSLQACIPAESQRMFSLMYRTYFALFQKLRRERCVLWSHRTRLDSPTKWRLAASHFLSPWYSRLPDPRSEP
jgi:phytoene synthase